MHQEEILPLGTAGTARPGLRDLPRASIYSVTKGNIFRGCKNYGGKRSYEQTAWGEKKNAWKWKNISDINRKAVFPTYPLFGSHSHSIFSFLHFFPLWSLCYVLWILRTLFLDLWKASWPVYWALHMPKKCKSHGTNATMFWTSTDPISTICRGPATMPSKTGGF